MDDLRDEPWTSCRIDHLQNVSSGRAAVLGPGARGNSRSIENSELQSPDRTSMSWENYWYDARNSKKLCIEGAFSNLMHHMQDEKVAIFIKMIATISNPKDIALEVGVPVCPKYVCKQVPDHFWKCI